MDIVAISNLENNTGGFNYYLFQAKNRAFLGILY